MSSIFFPCCPLIFHWQSISIEPDEFGILWGELIRPALVSNQSNKCQFHSDSLFLSLSHPHNLSLIHNSPLYFSCLLTILSFPVFFLLLTFSLFSVFLTQTHTLSLDSYLTCPLSPISHIHSLSSSASLSPTLFAFPLSTVAEYFCSSLLLFLTY